MPKLIQKYVFRIFALVLSICYLNTAKSQIYSDSISVNFFLLDECKISKSMTSYINEIYKQFNTSKLHFQGYFPNRSSKPDQIKTFMSTYKMEVPYETDYDKKRAIELGATKLPEVIVKDEKMNKVIYRGRINNLFSFIGSRRRVITSHDLKDVLNAILQGAVVEFSEKDAIGCLINFNEI